MPHHVNVQRLAWPDAARLILLLSLVLWAGIALCIATATWSLAQEVRQPQQLAVLAFQIYRESNGRIVEEGTVTAESCAKAQAWLEEGLQIGQAVEIQSCTEVPTTPITAAFAPTTN